MLFQNFYIWKHLFYLAATFLNMSYFFSLA
jgi:hypothetical protein